MGEIAGLETAQANPHNPRVAADEPSPSGIDQSAAPGRDDDEHLVGAEPPEREQHRSQRGTVGPLQIVQNQHHDPVAGLQAVEEIQQAGADSHRVVPRVRGRIGIELVHDPIRKERLVLVAASLEDHRVRERPEEPREQG